MFASSDLVFRRKIKMHPFSGSFSIFVSSLFHTLFRFFSSIFLRVYKEQVNESWSYMEPAAAMPQKAESDDSESDEDLEYYSVEEEEEERLEPSFVFKFEYQTKAILEAMEKVNAYDHTSVFEKENEIMHEEVSCRRYEFQAEKHVSFYEEEAKVSSFAVIESMVNDTEGFKGLVIEECCEKEEVESFVLKSFSFLVNDHKGVEQNVIEECVDSKNRILEEKDDQLKSQEYYENNIDSHEDKCLKENEVSVESASASDCDSSPLCLSPELSFMGQYSGNGFLSETGFRKRVDLDAMEDIDLSNFVVGYEAEDFDEEDEDVMKQLEELEESTRNDESTHEAKDEKPNENSQNSEKVSGQDLAATNDSDDANTLETLWEHQELIEQLKMELKKVRGSGLPTIREECELPNMEDLKPWKIDEEYNHGDKMSVIHMFYKSYNDRMRKFDILSYQKLYAIGFLQSRDTLETFSSCRSSTPAIKSFILQNFGLCKPKKEASESDPMVKFIRELHSELEVVYVGQLCLSWEFLQWQYEKALDIWEHDEYGLRSYKEVAEEFQQFQVLMHRFVENERFQGLRVENYVKNRCVMRNLMQIPVIREDSLKDKKKAKNKGQDFDVAIGSDLLVEILQESIRTLWRFIRADKSASITDACRKRSKSELEDSLDPKLLAQVQADLLKTERKLKEVLRSENYILKRFKKRHEEEEEEEESQEHLYFFCQVDIRVVSRVLNMSSITKDQLVWCHNKLNRIHVVNRKIRLDPSFLLFPCW